MALVHNKKVSIGTHDVGLINNVIDMNGPERNHQIEFEMLHGVNEKKLIELSEMGFQTRDYLIYGTEWYLYYFHRLAENPMNFIRAFVSLVYDDRG